MRSFEANCILCLNALFALEEFEIYEDFLQLSDLVEAQNIFVNRTELLTNEGKQTYFSSKNGSKIIFFRFYFWRIFILIFFKMTSFSVFMHKTIVCENLLFELLSYLSGVQSPRFACFIFQGPKIFNALLYISSLPTIV